MQTIYLYRKYKQEFLCNTKANTLHYFCNKIIRFFNLNNLLKQTSNNAVTSHAQILPILSNSTNCSMWSILRPKKENKHQLKMRSVCFLVIRCIETSWPYFYPHCKDKCSIEKNVRFPYEYISFQIDAKTEISCKTFSICFPANRGYFFLV